MLQEGKINADQAAKLLEALEEGKPEKSSKAEKAENEEKAGKWFRVRVTDAVTGSKRPYSHPHWLGQCGISDWSPIFTRVCPYGFERLDEFNKIRKTGLIIDVIDDEDDEHVEIFIE
jgi:hypothetical protein